MKELIQKIKYLTSFEDTSFYTFHVGLPLWRLFSGSQWNGIPYYLKDIFRETVPLIKDSNLTQEKILLYLANSQKETSYFFVCHNILIYGVVEKLSEDEIYDIISGSRRLPNSITIDEEILFCAVVAYALDSDRYNNWGFEAILPKEKFAYSTTDYKLTKVKSINFRQSGFVYDEKYYLYNIFIDRKPLEYFDKMPAVFKIISENIDLNKADLYLRLDERLAVPLAEADIADRYESEYFRGTKFSLSNTRLENMKNIIVHYNPESFDKLLMVIKKDFDTHLKEEFWHIELEQLPFLDSNKLRKNVCTTFIHGKYYPKRQAFRHIDFIKNQYPFAEYCQKHEDRSNQDIRIDYYTTKECHYKIWCVENTDISEDTWYKLSKISLDDKYRKLFDEIMGIGN